MALTVQKKEYPWKSRHTGGLVSSNPHIWLLGAIFTPLQKTYDMGKTSVARHCSRPTVIGISEPKLHGSVLTGRKCTFLGSWYPRGIAIFGRLTVNVNGDGHVTKAEWMKEKADHLNEWFDCSEGKCTNSYFSSWHPFGLFETGLLNHRFSQRIANINYDPWI